MADINRYFQLHLLKGNCCFDPIFNYGFVSRGPIDNKLSLVLVMAWCILAENLMTQYTDTYSPGLDVLTHLPLNKMAAILQMTFSNVFSWMKNFILISISLKFVYNKGSNSLYSSIGSDNGLVPTNDGYITDTYTWHSVSMS